MRFTTFAPPSYLNPALAQKRQTNACCTQGVNIAETKEAFEIEILLPGYAKEEVSIKVEGKFLTVNAQKANTENQEARKFNHREFTVSGFKRTFEFPDTVEVSAITAKQSNGILTLTLPKKTEAIPVNLQIEVQ